MTEVELTVLPLVVEVIDALVPKSVCAVSITAITTASMILVRL